MKRNRHGEDRLPVLDRNHAPGGEALAVANAIDLVDDGYLRVTAEQKVGVQRMRRTAGGIDGATGGDQRLADHLPAEDTLPTHLRRAAAKQIHFQLLEIENA
jgi:hypothetical protein